MMSPTRFGSIKSIVLGEMLFEKKYNRMAVFGFNLRYRNGMILDLPSHIALDSQVSSPWCILSGYKMLATLGMNKENKVTACLVDSYSIFHIITQRPIYGVIVYFLQCYEPVNYCPGNSFGY